MCFMKTQHTCEPYWKGSWNDLLYIIKSLFMSNRQSFIITQHLSLLLFDCSLQINHLELQLIRMLVYIR